MKKSVACRDTALPKISWCKTCQHFEEGVEFERERIIKLMQDQNIIRRDVTGKLVAFNTHGTEVVYIKDLEEK